MTEISSYFTFWRGGLCVCVFGGGATGVGDGGQDNFLISRIGSRTAVGVRLGG